MFHYATYLHYVASHYDADTWCAARWSSVHPKTRDEPSAPRVTPGGSRPARGPEGGQTASHHPHILHTVFVQFTPAAHYSRHV